MKAHRFPFATRPWLLVGGAAAAAVIIGAVFSGWTGFLETYLFVYLFWLGISLGCLAIAMVVYLMDSHWGHISRWILESGAKTLWLMAVLFIPIALGISRLYPWADPSVVAADPELAHKAAYLNVPFFLIRAAVYFAVWIACAHLLSGMAQRPAMYESVEAHRKLQRLAAIGLLAYGLTMTFAAVDWIMSLTPDWYSSIFGMMVALGQVLSGFAFVLVLLPHLAQQYEPVKSLISRRNYRDLGALLLTSVMVWAYLAFSQLLIIWSGNLPHEVTWYVDRSAGGWVWVGILVVAAEFFLPFFILLSLRAKQNPRLLAGLSLMILVMRLVDNYWTVYPAFSPGRISLHWLGLVLPFAIGGLWMALFTWVFARTSIYIPELKSAPAAARQDERPVPE